MNIKNQIRNAERSLDNSEKLEVMSLQFSKPLRFLQFEVYNVLEKLQKMEGISEC